MTEETAMPFTTTTVAVPEPAQFIQRLVASLGSDPDLSASGTVGAEGRATVRFGQGTCVLRPFSQVEVIVTAADRDALSGVRDASARLLRRTAEEARPEIIWTHPADGGDILLTDPVAEDYTLSHCTPADSVLGELASETREVTGRAAVMQVSADEGALLTMLAKLTSARFAVEVGVFTGYSSVCIARGLADGGRLLACDVSEEWTAIARRYWPRAGLDDRIDLKIGPAIDTLRALPAEPRIDFAFIDADKTGYPAYYEEIVPRLRPGGLVILDNVLQGGRVVDPAYREEHHLAVRRLNDVIAADTRVEAVMLPFRDGVTITRKR
ncbi:MAG TPA: class I SAM-dependent methyltransferase [Trebonia sp.]|nr:class I SAM-dependent methyltransferase [Trebonia sp.]